MKTYKLLCGTFALILLCSACEEPKLDKKAFFAQIASRECVITQIEIPSESKIITDTFKKAYNVQKQLIVENDNIFFRYDSTGKLIEKVICIDANCHEIMNWRYEYQKEKTLVRQFRNGALQQLQEIENSKKKNTSQATDSAYIFLEQEELKQNNVLQKGIYRFFENDTKNNSLLEQKYQYDSLGRLIQVVRMPDKDSSNCIKIAFQYDQEGRKNKSLHSRFMPYNGDIKHHIDHYKIYTYDAANRLVEVKTFSNRKEANTLFSITRYAYLTETLQR